MNVSFIYIQTIATDRELSPKKILHWDLCEIAAHYYIGPLRLYNGIDRLCALKELIAVNQHFLEEEGGE
jgi:hypothetical protein